MRINRILTSVFALTVAVSCVPTSLFAQADEEPIIRANFTVYSLQRPVNIKFINGDRKTATPVNFYSSSRSEKYSYEGLNPIVFFQEYPAPTESDPGAVERKKVAEVSLPPTGGEFLFIFFPTDDSDSDTYRIYPMDDSTSAFPFGAIRLFNATPFTLEGVLGRERIRLEPGPSKAYRVNSYKTALGLGFRHNDSFHQSFNSPVEMESGARGLMMIFPPFVKGSAIVQTRFIRENPAGEPNSSEEGVSSNEN